MQNKRRKRTPAKQAVRSLALANPTGTEIPAWLDRVRTRHDFRQDDSARNIFLERAFEAIIEMTKALPSQALEESAAAGSNFLVLLKALQSPEVLPELERYEPLASPYLKGLQAQQDLLKRADGVMTSEEVAEMLKLTRQAVDKRRQAGKLIAIPQGERGFGYPVCQFNARGPIAGLEQMLLALGTTDAWGQLAFLLSPNSALGNRAPLDLLREGQIAPVTHVATIFGEHGSL
jgi:hypothetical protein